VSHELKTPLMVMKSELDIAKRTQDYSILDTNMNNTIYDMQSIVETLLTVTRLQAQESIIIDTINLSDTINEIISNLQKKHSEKDIDIEVN
jgi:signal transduction histidine kinase